MMNNGNAQCNATNSPLLSLSALQSVFRSGFQTSPSFARVSQMRGSIVAASSIPSQLGMLCLCDYDYYSDSTGHGGAATYALWLWGWKDPYSYSNSWSASAADGNSHIDIGVIMHLLYV